MKDWKEGLGEADKKHLDEILHNVEKHRRAYRTSGEISTSQLWSALLEHKKGSERIVRRIGPLEALARRQKPETPVIIERAREMPKSYWQLPIGAVPLVLSLLILANISLAESASLFSFASSLAIAFSMVVFGGFLWFSAFKD